MSAATAAPEKHPDFRDPDLIAIRTARKAHPCQMVRENPVIEERTPTGTHLVDKYPGRPKRFRKWDGGPIPADHTPTIARGSQYVEYFGETPAYQSGDRYCLACARAARMVAP